LEAAVNVILTACSSSYAILLTWLALPATWAWPWIIARQRQLHLLDDGWPSAPNYHYSDNGNNRVIISECWWWWWWYC